MHADRAEKPRLWGAYTLLAAVILAVLACAVAPAPAHAAPPKSPPSRSTGGDLVEIRGISYLSTAAFAKRHGLKSAWMKAGRRIALVGANDRVELEVDAREARVNGLRIFLGEPARLYRRSLYLSRIDAERLIGPMVQPTSVKADPGPVRVVALDPGHGGRDSGKVNQKLKVFEKTLTLDVANRTKRLLEAAGFKVVLTRTDDRYIELDDRPARAARAGADLFVSIHFNAVEKRAEQVTGVEVFSLTPRYQYSTDDYNREATTQAREVNPGNRSDPWNAVLAYRLHKQLLGELKVPDRGHKRARFKVLRLASCPAVLVEAGYLSNDSEARKAATPAYRQKVADALAEGIIAYAADVRRARN